MRIYAKQVPPEHQESPLCYGNEFWPENVIFDGNNNYRSRTIPEYDHIIRYFNEMAGEWENTHYWYERTDTGYKKRKVSNPEYTLAEILGDYGFRRNDGKPWTTQQRHTWKTLMEDFPEDEDEAYLTMLELLTGKKWRTGCIHGCSQGDWQTIYYPIDEWDKNSISHLEMEYFNTGSEWYVWSEKEDENEGFSMYCYEWDDESIKEEIANATSEIPENVTLCKFSGYSRTAQYEEV